MKHILPAIAATFLVLPIAGAQQSPLDQSPEKPPRTQQERPDRGAMLQKELGLTDAQNEQVAAVMRESREKGQAIREDATLSEEQKAEAQEKNRAETRTKLSSILTPEQLTKWEQMRERMRERQGRGGRGEGRREGRTQGQGEKSPQATPAAP